MDVEDWHIYVVEGAEELAKLEAFAADRDAKAEAMHEWCVAHGGTGTMAGNYTYAMIVPKTVDDLPGWKRCDQEGVPEGSVAWSPITKTKEGRSLARQLRAYKLPDGVDAAGVIGLSEQSIKWLPGGRVRMLRSQCVTAGRAWVLLYPKETQAREIPGCRLIKPSEFYALKEAAEQPAGV